MIEAMTRLHERSITPLYIRVLSVDGGNSTEALDVLSWFEPGQSMFKNFWTLLGIADATVHIHVGNSLEIEMKDRKLLAAEAHSAMKALVGKKVGPIADSEPKNQ